jgi:exopolysaccharide biosynthesis polyprenyl glycosylphosphotransferase
MLSERDKAYRFTLASADVLVLLVAFIGAYALRNTFLNPFLNDLQAPGIGKYAWLLTWAVPVYLWLLYRGGAYDLALRSGPFEMLLLVSRPMMLGTMMLGSVIFLVQAKNFSRVIFLCFASLSFVGLYAVRLIVKRSLRRAILNRRVVRYCLMVGTNSESVGFARILNSHAGLGMIVLGYLSEDPQPKGADVPILGSFGDIALVLDRMVVDEVVIALPTSQLGEIQDLIATCQERGVTVHIKADFARGYTARTSMSLVAGAPFLTLRSTPHLAADIVVKRFLDIAIAGSVLVLLAPALAVVAVLVRLTSKGPAIFRQTRVGVNGRTFSLYKFRSMYADANDVKGRLMDRNEMSGPVFKIKRDPRVTRVGGLLRRYSIDELPQLWNVLKGDMSLVGPRPPLPEEVKSYTGWQRRRLSVKPGITCLWQVFGRNEVDFEKWMELDLQYINQWSLALDVKILLRTIPAVLMARGAR